MYNILSNDDGQSDDGGMVTSKLSMEIKMENLEAVVKILVTIAPMAPFTPKINFKVEISALHFRYSTVIPRFIPWAKTAQSY